jgi:double zinc ribbon protein
MDTEQVPTENDDPFETISNFFDSDTWGYITLALKVFAVALWLALVYWTFQDARRRIREPALIVGSVALSLLIPFLGTLIYMVVRPPEYLADAHERELEVLALERRVDEAHCPDCDYPIQPKFLSCPSCLRKLRDQCTRCAEPLDPRWKICPYCEHVVQPEGLPDLPPDRIRPT